MLFLMNATIVVHVRLAVAGCRSVTGACATDTTGLKPSVMPLASPGIRRGRLSTSGEGQSNRGSRRSSLHGSTRMTD